MACNSAFRVVWLWLKGRLAKPQRQHTHTPAAMRWRVVARDTIVSDDTRRAHSNIHTVGRRYRWYVYEPPSAGGDEGTSGEGASGESTAVSIPRSNAPVRAAEAARMDTAPDLETRLLGPVLADRSCGECTACCTVLTVDTHDFKKPAGVPCQHLCERGCDIHAIRPHICRTWFCAWRRVARMLRWAIGTLRFFRASTSNPCAWRSRASGHRSRAMRARREEEEERMRRSASQ